MMDANADCGPDVPAKVANVGLKFTFFQTRSGKLLGPKALYRTLKGFKGPLLGPIGWALESPMRLFRHA